jgi:hypothetical protein
MIHPGEHFDLGLIINMADPSDMTFDVSWQDKNGKHGTMRTINL